MNNKLFLQQKILYIWLKISKIMIQRIYQFAILAIFVLAITSCEKNPQFKVGLLMDDTLQERWEKDMYFIESELKELNGKTSTLWAYGDENLQYQQALDLIREGVDILIIIPVNLEAAAAIVAEAHKMDIKVIAYDRLIKNCDLDYYVSFDNVQVGFMQASYCANLSPKGDYAIINGPTKDNNSFLLQLGQMAYLQPLVEKGDINIKYQVFSTEWNVEQGNKNFIESLKTSDSIKAFICGNDALALGAINGYKSLDSTLSKNYLFTGQDADIKNCKLVLEGTQSMTVYKPIKKAAQIAALIAQSLVFEKDITAEGQTTVNNNKLMVPTILIPPISLDKTNLKETLITEGFFNEEDFN